MKHHAIILLALTCTALGLSNSLSNDEGCQVPGIKRSVNPRKFVVCVEKDGKLTSVENECSKGLTFDVTKKTCTRLFPAATVLQALVPKNANSSTPRPSSASISDRTSVIDIVTPIPSWATTVGPTPPKQPCKGPGAYCSDCHTLSFCVSYNFPNGEKFLQTISNLPCGDDSLCVTQQGCVKKINGGLCREGPFVCADVGLYPDPYDCKTFHSCTISPWGQLIDTPSTCSGGLLGNRWNPQTSTCGWPENVDSCRKSPVPMCTKPLEMSTVGGQIYSICIADEIAGSLSPRLFRCPQDLVFNASSYSCANPLNP